MTKDEALRLALEALEWQQEMLYTAMQYSAAKGMTFLGHPPNPNEAITAIKAALEAKDEPVVWGASSISKPEYIAEQKAKTSQLRNMMDEAVQTVPNFDQLQQIVNNLERCLTKDSKHEFLRVWIRDWTEHKLSKHTSAALEAKDEPDHSDELTIAYMSGLHRGKEVAQRTWVGLTADEYAELAEEYGPFPINQIEAKLKQKNCNA
jgi:hypothetical protein